MIATMECSMKRHATGRNEATGATESLLVAMSMAYEGKDPNAIFFEACRISASRRTECEMRDKFSDTSSDKKLLESHEKSYQRFLRSRSSRKNFDARIAGDIRYYELRLLRIAARAEGVRLSESDEMVIYELLSDRGQIFRAHLCEQTRQILGECRRLGGKNPKNSAEIRQ